MTQEGLFDTVEHPTKTRSGPPVKQRVLITVKAAPNPSATYGETVCVAGVRLGAAGPAGWIRLYPINFRHLPDASAQFKKYDIVTVECRPANEPRVESWKPDMNPLTHEMSVPPWEKRRRLLDPLIEDSMCAIRKSAETDPSAQSLALVRPAEVLDFTVRLHPGWSKDEQRKIDQYVGQLELFSDQDKSPLEAPRFTGTYKWRCGDRECKTHEQRILDWEFVALQRKVSALGEAEAKDAIRRRFLDEVCAADRDIAFYVGNQAKRHQTFSILGVFWPPTR